MNLRTEKDMMAAWKGDATKPLVSVRCITFNHANYIEEAIRGFLGQLTDFPFEVIIHDDASTDGTPDIIRRYEAEYPHIIRAIYQEKNQYSQGVPVEDFVDPLLRGEFCAICEGDDAWISPHKLQRQVDALRANPGVDLCIHPATMYCAYEGNASVIGKYPAGKDPVPLSDIVQQRCGQIPTASTLIRRGAFEAFVSFKNEKKLSVHDIYIFFFGAMRGGAMVLPDVMSLYRVHLGGSWSRRFKTDMVFRFRHVLHRIEDFGRLDRYTGGKHAALLGDIQAHDRARAFKYFVGLDRHEKTQVLAGHRQAVGGISHLLVVAVYLTPHLLLQLARKLLRLVKAPGKPGLALPAARVRQAG